jgi:hypothetical protein
VFALSLALFGFGFSAKADMALGDAVTATLNPSLTVLGTGTTAYTYNGQTVRSNQGGLFYWDRFVPGPNGTQLADPFRTACIEIGQHIYWNQAHSFTAVDPTDAPKPTFVSGMAPLAAQYLSRLWTDNYVDVLGAITNNASNKNFLAGVLQIATWKLVYDGGANLNLLDNLSNFYTTQASNLEITTAQAWLNKLANLPASHNLLALSSLTYQDQIVFNPRGVPQSTPVPEPTTVAIWGLLGAFGLVCNKFLSRQR